MAKLNNIRCFIGVPLDANLAARLPPLWEQALPAQAGPVLRPVAPANLHLTLVFLGDQTPELIHTLHQQLQQPLTLLPAFTLRSHSINIFPDAKSPIVALEFQPAAALQQLKQTLDTVLQRNGVALESRPLRPHVTLARGKQGLRLALTPVVSEWELQVNEICLFESVHGAVGSDYRPLWSIGLAKHEEASR